MTVSDVPVFGKIQLSDAKTARRTRALRAGNPAAAIIAADLAALIDGETSTRAIYP